MIWIACVLLAAGAAGAPTKVSPQTASPISVYFDRNSDQLTPGALDTLVASARLVQTGDRPIRVEGHTSTIGDEVQNVGLSQSRALIVRQALLALGVADTRITTAAYGESSPARPTANGVHEALNDRVVIVLQ